MPGVVFSRSTWLGWGTCIQYSSFLLAELLTCDHFQFSSVAQSCLTLHIPVDCSTSGFPVHHQLLKLIQTHVHRVDDAIQPSHPLLSPPLPVFSLFQDQGLFHWVGSSHQVVKVLELQLQHQSFWWIFRADSLYVWLVWSSCSPRDSQESSMVPQLKSINFLALMLSLWSNSHIHIWLMEKP